MVTTAAWVSRLRFQTGEGNRMRRVDHARHHLGTGERRPGDKAKRSVRRVHHPNQHCLWLSYGCNQRRFRWRKGEPDVEGDNGLGGGRLSVGH